jgi:hypothetical protein
MPLNYYKSVFKRREIMKKYKRLRYSAFIILIILILFLVGYLMISKNKNYKIIDRDTKEKIAAMISESKGQFPNLQTESARAHWIDEAHNSQKQMMDKVLDSLTVAGESKTGLPSQYIIATYYDVMNVYIPYQEKNYYKNIIIEADGHYYIAAGDKEAINAIVDFMKKALLIVN